MSETDLKVTTIIGWTELPEISFPTLRDAFQTGSIYTVHKIGFLSATPEQCAEAAVVGEMMGYGGKCILPTVVVDFDDSKKLCRLPLDLGGWALQSVHLAHGGINGLPARVEFGVLQGRHYAEIL